MKIRAANILLLLISVILTLALLESIVRIFHLVPESEEISTEGLVFSTNPRLRYTMKPNGRWTHHGTVININEDGFRGKPINPADRNDNVIRILAIGDSITLGLYLEDEGTYCHQLEALLNKQHLFGKRWEVINFGVNGYNTINEVELLKVRGLNYKPDLVLLQYCFNDHNNKSELNMRLARTLADNHKLIYLMLNPSLKILRKSKLFLFCALRLKTVQVNLKDVARLGSEYIYRGDYVSRGFSELSELSRQNDFSTMVFIFPRFERNHRRFSNYQSEYFQIEELCKKNRMPYLNLLSYFILNHDGENTYPDFHIDSCHPSAYGNKAVAEAIAEKIETFGPGLFKEGG
jgi:lysophospholipase L1-like esterase